MGEGSFTCDEIISDTFVNEVLSHKHCANLHSFTVEQMIKIEEHAISLESVLQDYAYMCKKAYLSGSHELSLEPLVIDEPVSSTLRLHSVGLMKIDKIQNSLSQCILQVLFDTGSDKTLFNKQALPKQAISAKDPSPSNITGVHRTKPLNCFVMLNGMQFPEFAPTTKVAKPVKAIVFDNEESSYDVILGMDVLQPLGFKIDCATLKL
jgi:hypothetical protein